MSEPVIQERRLPLGAALPLRVGVTGPLSREFASGVEAVRLDDSGDLAGLDAVVLEPGAGGREGLAADAHAAGTPVIALDQGSLAPPLDPAVFNPTTFRDAGVAGLAAMVARSGSGFEAGFELIAGAARDEPVTVFAVEGAELPPLPPGSRRARLGTHARPLQVVRKAQEHLGVLDHPSFHSSDYERAGWIAKLCAAGVPVCAAEISEQLAALLGEELTALLRPLRARDLADLDFRERASVALRRAALREHSATARWRQIAAELGLSVPGRPLVSVVLSTRRESWLEHGIAQVARQTYEPRELVVCLHGDEFAPGTSDRVRSLYPGVCQVIRVDSELTLGDALNAGVETSNGELVTKMDDDDYYSTEHLWDLVLALEYSGADLVGKAAEFVYLEEIDVTLRQISQDVDTRMAGGGMMAVKGPLQEVGGWPQRSRGEDLHLIRRFTGAGRPIRRIPPHGYILNRHGIDHTWRPQVDYFLFRSDRQWRGLGFDVTAIEKPTDPYSRIPWT